MCTGQRALNCSNKTWKFVLLGGRTVFDFLSNGVLVLEVDILRVVAMTYQYYTNELDSVLHDIRMKHCGHLMHQKHLEHCTQQGPQKIQLH